jgi:hypothetical protein
MRKHTANLLQLLNDSAWQILCLDLCAALSTSYVVSTLTMLIIQVREEASKNKN